MLKNRSQMEIMGLVVIIILIAIGMLFAVQFLLKKPTGVQEASVKESVLAANFLNSMLSTTTVCHGSTIKELLEDCALTSGAADCMGSNSCDYASSQIEMLLDRTLGRWNKAYYFSIEGAYDVEQIKFGAPCPGEKEAKVHPAPVRPGFEIKLKLEICG